MIRQTSQIVGCNLLHDFDRCTVSWRPSKIACVADTLHRLYRPGRTITMASNDARLGRLQRRLIEKIIKGTYRPNHGLASTSRMRTAISPRKWQLWTACSQATLAYWGSSISMAASAWVIWLCACVR